MKRALLAAVAIVLTACGGGNDEPPDEESLADQTGCDTLTEEPTEEIYVREKFDCDGEAVVYTFNNTDGRDGWLDIAETFGSVVLEEGDTWLKVEP